MHLHITSHIRLQAVTANCWCDLTCRAFICSIDIDQPNRFFYFSEWLMAEQAFVANSVTSLVSIACQVISASLLIAMMWHENGLASLYISQALWLGNSWSRQFCLSMPGLWCLYGTSRHLNILPFGLQWLSITVPKLHQYMYIRPSQFWYSLPA